MIRVTGGKFKGRRLLVPVSKKVRPTTEKVRESIFSIIGDKVLSAFVLDVFAGTGALGLEALSRGAGRVIFIERDPQVFAILRRNISLCGAEKDSEAYCVDWLKGVKKLAARNLQFDLIFADPPYEAQAGKRLFENLYALTHKETIVIFEHSVENPFEFDKSKWDLIKVKEYGETAVDFFRPL